MFQMQKFLENTVAFSAAENEQPVERPREWVFRCTRLGRKSSQRQFEQPAVRVLAFRWSGPRLHYMTI